ncbi:Pectate lyase [Rhizoctonia solani]|uniref:Pectate lyase n=1 Tax=Rhizoctonia solani TaxID=456999 RepID=A0A8H7IAN6_9AGAM|nr:Pectate lyase [Rhizoctonia solani]
MVHFSFATVAVVAGFFAQAALALPSPTIERAHVKRAASCTFPTPPKTSSLSGNVRYDRGSGACTGQKEGGDKDAVFILESGATIQNVVIGANQAEGIHCKGSCNIYNVWFEDVCEDAITIKQTSGTSTIRGGGAKGADDKVEPSTSSPTASRTLASSIALAETALHNQYKRTVNISNIIAKNGKLIAGVNSNYGDVAHITGTNTLTSIKSICNTFKGNSNGDEPTTLTTNVPNTSCDFKA